MITSIFQIDSQALLAIPAIHLFKTPAIVCEGKPRSSYRVPTMETYHSFHFDMGMMRQKMQGEIILPEHIETAEDVHAWIMGLSEDA